MTVDVIEENGNYRERELSAFGGGHTWYMAADDRRWGELKQLYDMKKRGGRFAHGQKIG
jgi:hypothetical protein